MPIECLWAVPELPQVLRRPAIQRIHYSGWVTALCNFLWFVPGLQVDTKPDLVYAMSSTARDKLWRYINK